MIELLNELRIALPGVQILFAFLLPSRSPSASRDLTAFQRDVFYVTLLATALSTGCLIAPSAAHRLRFHQGDREWLVESANTLLIAGLGFLAIAIGAAFLLITDLLFDGARVWIYSALVWAAIVGLWFGRPLTAALPRATDLVGDRARVARRGERRGELLADLALAVGGLRQHRLLDEHRRAGHEREVDARRSAARRPSAPPSSTACA